MAESSSGKCVAQHSCSWDLVWAPAHHPSAHWYWDNSMASLSCTFSTHKTRAGSLPTSGTYYKGKWRVGSQQALWKQTKTITHKGLVYWVRIRKPSLPRQPAFGLGQLFSLSGPYFFPSGRFLRWPSQISHCPMVFVLFFSTLIYKLEALGSLCKLCSGC